MELDEKTFNMSILNLMYFNKTTVIKQDKRLEAFIIYPLIYTIGLIWNSMSTYVFSKKDVQKQSCSNYLAVRSIVDTGYLLTSMITWLDGFDVRVSHLPGVCQMLFFTGHVCSFVSACCTVFIAVENFIRICKPSMVRKVCNERNSRVAVAVSFITGIGLNSFFIFALETHEFNGRSHCIENPTSKTALIETILIVADFIITGPIPIIINSCLIVLILQKAKKARQFYFERKRRRGTNVFTPTNKTKRPIHGKVLALLLGLLSMHIFLRCPYQVTKLLTLFWRDVRMEMTSPLDADVMFSFMILFCLNFASTGIVYFTCGKSYRKHVCRLFSWVRDFIRASRYPGEENHDDYADTYDRFSCRFQSGSSFAFIHTQQTVVP